MLRGLAILVTFGLLIPAPSSAWGLRSHRWINESAVTTLPVPLRPVFESASDRLANLAVEPDTVLRDRYGRRETVRHFIDLDLYGDPPFDELPRSFEAAVRRHGRERVVERGVLPWTLERFRRRLAGQMQRGAWDDALRTAGLAGHYLADAFMPLHTTANHDGRQTGNDGLHRRLEFEIVDERLLPKRARDLLRTLEPADGRFTGLDAFFAVLLDSHAVVGELLRADDRARTGSRGGRAVDLDLLAREVDDLLLGRLAASASAVGSLWTSAWIAAGRPEPPSAEATLIPRGADSRIREDDPSPR